MTPGAPSLADDLALIVEAARAAAEMMMAMRATARVHGKADGSPVTDADLAVDAMLRETLTAARPDYGWLSEETPDGPERLARERVFVVDPIDGTTAYIRKKPWFAVSIAVVENGRPAAGVVLAPAVEELYAAARNRGATLNGAPIQARDTQTLDGAAFVGDPAQFPHPPWPPLAFVRRNALAYRLARVAAGEFDAAVSVTPKKEWDIAAGAVIAAEAGAAVCDAQGAPLVFNSVGAATPGLIACARALRPLILAHTAAIGET